MNYKKAFGSKVRPRKKKARLIAMSQKLIDFRADGATYAQLAEYVTEKEGMPVSTDWLEKVIRAEMKKK